MVMLGESLTVSVKAQGSGLTYQWYYKKLGKVSFAAWKGHTHASETVTPPATWNNIQLYCVVKDASGKSVKSDTIIIYVTGIEVLPGEYNCCYYQKNSSEYFYDDLKYLNSTGFYINLFVYDDDTACLCYYNDYELVDSVDLVFDGETFSAGDEVLNYYPELYDGSKKLKEGKDYVVKGINNIEEGADAYAYVRGIGKYDGYALIPINIGTKFVKLDLPTSIINTSYKIKDNVINDIEDGITVKELLSNIELTTEEYRIGVIDAQGNELEENEEIIFSDMVGVFNDDTLVGTIDINLWMNKYY